MYGSNLNLPQNNWSTATIFPNLTGGILALRYNGVNEHNVCEKIYL